MSNTSERVSEVTGNIKHSRAELTCPEGVELDVRVAAAGERLFALFIDLLIMGLGIVFFVLIAILFHLFDNTSSANIFILFLAFLVRISYFLHFELVWQGRTIGKKLLNLRVINRNGGELTPSAIIARNLSRELEIFLPLSLYASYSVSSDMTSLSLFAWSAIFLVFPLFNRSRLRIGDIIAGTQVVVMPKQVLLSDLTLNKSEKGENREVFTFTPAQLSKYGNFELQVLEEVLRQPDSVQLDANLKAICSKICNKIEWQGKIPSRLVRIFLMDFYAAERDLLERNQLYGKKKEDKNS